MCVSGEERVRGSCIPDLIRHAGDWGSFRFARALPLCENLHPRTSSLIRSLSSLTSRDAPPALLAPALSSRPSIFRHYETKSQGTVSQGTGGPCDSPADATQCCQKEQPLPQREGGACVGLGGQAGFPRGSGGRDLSKKDGD